MKPCRTAFLLGALALLALALPILAQVQGGNLYGRVLDEKGGPVAGATLTLTGPGAPLSAASDSHGLFHFLGLPPGRYSLDAQLSGFSPFHYGDLTISLGHNATVDVTLSGIVKEELEVTAASPLLDERRVVTGATLSQTQLAEIPTARDPWALLAQVPGVLLDRVNIGGLESNQQAAFVGPGSAGSQAVCIVDGVTISDPGQTGSSPTFFDFDSFDEVQVTTGGADASLPTGGVVLNLVTKRGTDQLRGSGRYLVDRGELPLEQTSMQGIKAWAAANPAKLREALNSNPSYVFFRELPPAAEGPPGALGVPLTAEYSLAVDRRFVPLGAPVYLATTHPITEQKLERMMAAQDTGGAIRGAVRADFYFGTGAEAGVAAGRMRQQGKMWLMWPRGEPPPRPD